MSAPSISLPAPSAAALRRAAVLLARLALGASFLSAVADRFSLWGPPGTPGVSWGDWAAFVSYTAEVNAFLPSALAPVLAVLATAAEVVLGVALLLGVRLRVTAVAAGALLTAFGCAMLVSLGLKKPMDYSVFSAAAAAFLLAAAAHERPLRAP